MALEDQISHLDKGRTCTKAVHLERPSQHMSSHTAGKKGGTRVNLHLAAKAPTSDGSFGGWVWIDLARGPSIEHSVEESSHFSGPIPTFEGLSSISIPIQWRFPQMGGIPKASLFDRMNPPAVGKFFPKASEQDFVPVYNGGIVVKVA